MPSRLVLRAALVLVVGLPLLAIVFALDLPPLAEVVAGSAAVGASIVIAQALIPG